MTRFGFGPQGMVLLGTSSSEDDKSLAGFEELVMPLFDSLYNFCTNFRANHCRSRLEPSCHGSPGLEGQFASRSGAVPRRIS
jgi:hypothetical protein